MKTSTDYFDLAVKNTFVKTSQIPCVSSPSFGLFHPGNQNNDESSNSPLGLDCIASDLTNGTVDLSSSLESSRINPEVSYTAKALEEIENIRKMSINVRFFCGFFSSFHFEKNNLKLISCSRIPSTNVFKK